MDFHFTAPEENEDPTTERPVVVITDEMMDAYRASMRRNRPPITAQTLISPLFDESVHGYASDKHPAGGGVQAIVQVVNILEAADISCCRVAEPALIYYGAGRVMLEWIMCVPTEKLERASEIFRALPEFYEPFRPSAMKRVGGLEDFFPRFKFVGLGVFFIVMSSQSCLIPCKPENIVHSDLGIPYPTLPVYAQSLLDSDNLVDLDDLIDGMNLTMEWGEKYLDLNGTIDVEYGRWKADLLVGGKATEGQIPMWCMNPPKRRDIWLGSSSKDAKKNRQGFKYNPSFETRFWKHGTKDSRRD